MMDDGQTRQEASNQTTLSLLQPKQRILIGSWNVRTLYQTGKLAQATSEMNSYQLDIMAVCEARWTGSGRQNLASGHTILYSGRDDNQHLNGVALILSKKAKHTLIEWKPLGERLLKARFNSKFAKMTVIVCYAPQEDKSVEEKEEFYEKLNETVQETPRHDVIIALGDLNAKVGQDNSSRERTFGKEGLNQETNDNGERLIDFCEENNLIIGGTLFKHREIHKYTWTSPDGKTKNQIDHIMINKKWRTSLLDVKTKRGADIASDHELVVAKVKLKLRKAKIGCDREGRFDTAKLQNEHTAQEFKLDISNRFEVLLNEQELNIAKFNQEVLQVSQRILGPRKTRKEQWISEDSWKLIRERKQIKEKILKTKSPRIQDRLKKEYSTIDKSIKRSIRQDKKNYFDTIADRAEKANEKQDMRTLYQTSKILAKDFQNCDVPVKDTDGKTLPSELQQMKRWKEHFESILNREPPRCRPNILHAPVDLEINTEPPTTEEIKKAIESLNDGKAAGEDQVTAEMLKIEKENTPKILQKIFSNIWETEELPCEWSTGLIVKLPKKGDLSECGNWRGIMLLSITSKIFSRIVLQRMNMETEPKLRKQQAGFRKGRSCSDHIFTIRQIFEQSQEWNSTVFANFIDFEKAFDSVHRPALWKILRHYGIPSKIVNIIKMLYSNFHAKVICGNKLTEELEINTGVKQGCILSPFLFCLAIDWIMKESVENKKTGISWTFFETLEDLDFADDIVLLAHNFNDVQCKTQQVASNAIKLGLKINVEKTKTMRMNSNTNKPVRLNNGDIEDVKHFTYLGSKISQNGNCEDEIKERMSKARRAFWKLRNIWKERKISTKTKLRFYKTNVLSVLLYGAESWKLTSSICNKLDAFQNKCLRKILRIFWPRVISNQELYKRTLIEPVSETVRRRRWKWTGHVLRMDSNAIPRIALRWTPQGTRKRGRPLETWRRNMEKEMKSKGWSWGQMTKMASDRDRWRSAVSALCAAQAPRG